MALDQGDLDLIERLIYKNSDDVAVSIARSFERIEKQIEAAECRFTQQVIVLQENVLQELRHLLDE